MIELLIDTLLRVVLIGGALIYLPLRVLELNRSEVSDTD